MREYVIINYATKAGGLKTFNAFVVFLFLAGR